MGLNVYELADPGAAFSNDQSFTNALSVTADGIVGTALHRRYYVRNDDNALWYNNLKLQAVVLQGDDIVTGATEGFRWKLIAGNEEPLEEVWDLTSGGNQISLSDIGEAGTGDITTFLPFWLRIEIPRSSQVRSYQNIGLTITADENLV